VGGGGGHEGLELGQADVSVVVVGVRLLYFPPLDLDRRFQIRLSTAAARVSLLNKKKLRRSSDLSAPPLPLLLLTCSPSWIQVTVPPREKKERTLPMVRPVSDAEMGEGKEVGACVDGCEDDCYGSRTLVER
jgi:hypothetical protein